MKKDSATIHVNPIDNAPWAVWTLIDVGGGKFAL
jgi:hypothetical protein